MVLLRKNNATRRGYSSSSSRTRVQHLHSSGALFTRRLRLSLFDAANAGHHRFRIKVHDSATSFGRRLRQDRNPPTRAVERVVDAIAVPECARCEKQEREQKEFHFPS